jgi:V8-like Glu-specific endopeptidase
MMKISPEKNLVFARQPKPILAKDVGRLVKAKPAGKRLEGAELEVSRLLPAKGAHRIEAALDSANKATLRITNFEVGRHEFPPNIETKGVKTLGAKSRNFSKPLVTQAYRPDHLALQPAPRELPSRLRTPPFFQSLRGPDDVKLGNQATTIFPPDNRMVFADTSYPWSTCGRVDSPLGQGSGAMVGPRHLLTVSHVIQWNSDGSAGWVRFRPAYFAPSQPFGDAWAVRTYYKYKVQGPTVDWIESMYDYVVCVMDRRIGDWTGWLGGKGYTDAWDGGAYWAHVGYPGDLTGGNRPTFQGGISLDGVWWEPDAHEAMSHLGDVWPGQSGGPFFGWWSGWPYAVGVQSSQNSSENNASGGQDLVDLILRARADFP